MQDRAALDKLAPRDRDILAVLALHDEAIARTPWLAAAGEGGVRDERGRKIDGPAFGRIVDELVAPRLVTLADQAAIYYVPPWWVEPIVEDAQRRGTLRAIARGVGGRSSAWTTVRPRRPLLVALAERDMAAAAKLETLFLQSARRWDPTTYVDVIGLEPSEAWLDVLSPHAQIVYIGEAVRLAFAFTRRLGVATLARAMHTPEPDVRARVAMILAFSGDVAGARSALAGQGASAWIRGAGGVIQLVEGDSVGARETFEAAGTSARGKRVELPGVLALFDCLLAVTSDDAAIEADSSRRLGAAARALDEYPASRDTLARLLAFRRSGHELASALMPANPLDGLVLAVVRRWTGATGAWPPGFSKLARFARDQGYVWIADELERAIGGASREGLLALSGTKEGWELALESMQRAASPGEDERVPAKAARTLWWTVDTGPNEAWFDIDGYLVGPRGGKGTKASIPGLRRDHASFDEADQRVIDALERWTMRPDFAASARLLVPLIGHPRVRDKDGKALVIERGQPRIEVQRTADGARVVLAPTKFGGGVAVVRTGSRLVVVEETPTVRALLGALPSGAMNVPQRGLPRLYETLAALGGALEVVADELKTEASRPADGRLHVQLTRSETSLRARIVVLPAGDGGPAIRPGAPPGELVADGGNGAGLVRLVRDLDAERARLDAILARCPTLDGLGPEGNASDLETCLELLSELRDLGSDVEVTWLAGRPLRVPSPRTAASVRVRVKETGGWLTVDGELSVDDDRVVAMADLLDMRSEKHGRFVRVGEDEYVALTEDLRRKLDGLARVRTLSADGKIPAALLPVDELWDGLDVSFSKALEKRRAALESARSLAVPVPRTLTAELRDYQRDGLVFLARRAAAGLGACLADDMGLGKTVQAIALLLHRRKSGPALVVVPTSVRRNWEVELGRFAPSLDVRRFGEGDRAACVKDAAAGQVVLVTYGLLVAEEALLASRAWGTVVLDEAHALKNASTQRWSAARALRGEATIALTGTPLENHAGELHALLDLLVPGMLGTRTGFDRALGNAIANGDRDAAALLRRIVRPLVMRRTKEEVLSELPPRTEMTQVVTPGDEQLAFYEAIRRKALASLASARKGTGASAGKARIALLAEITRLRRAAIDPRLVGGPDAPAGTKLDALVELVVQLKAERRRALVFSQFLEVLDLARARLEPAGIACLRLDGSMSESARADAVASFQDGAADVFLVSLKAGGVGMNLTAADFVIFLDPWWNPAVEDQATARAHRMGQSRPVTVVRLVTECTIEEKVLALHAKKRKLYEDIVSEADGTGTLSVEALGALLGD